MNHKLALLLNKHVHEKCENVPHDIGIELEKIVSDYYNYKTEDDKHLINTFLNRHWFAYDKRLEGWLKTLTYGLNDIDRGDYLNNLKEDCKHKLPYFTQTVFNLLNKDGKDANKTRE